MWNPRSWDPDNIKFSFEEMVRTGTQYVFYPTVDPETYKLLVGRNQIGYSWVYGGGSDPIYTAGILMPTTALSTDTMTDFGI